MNLSWKQILLFIRLSRPLFLLEGVLLYGLGDAIAYYIGRPIHLSTFLLGLVIVLLIQLMGQYLSDYWKFGHETDRSYPSPSNQINDEPVPQVLPRRTALYAAAFALALIASTSLLLLSNAQVPLIAWLILLLGFLAAFFYALPPISLATTGYGELICSFAIAGLIPAFAYALQTGEIHRFLIMSCTPLIAQHLAMLIVFELPNYATDTKRNYRNILIRLGWPLAMRFHDIAIIFSIVSIVVAFFLGMPLRVAINTLIALPLALALIWQMERIRRGYPPRWRTLTYGALALFALTAYLEILGYMMI
jgi:1,4-dihydroxy-2-naphthoate octaprenyltransferase